MFKRMLSILVVVVLSVVGMSTVACADEVSPNWLYTSTATSELSFLGTAATCKSEAKGYIAITTEIVITQTLQKNTSGLSWSTVKTWTETDTGYIGSATNRAYLLPSGTYRLKTVFKVYSGTQYETITKYSSSVTI